MLYVLYADRKIQTYLDIFAFVIGRKTNGQYLTNIDDSKCLLSIVYKNLDYYRVAYVKL